MNNKHDNKLKKYKIALFKEIYYLVSDENEENLLKSVEMVNEYIKNTLIKSPEIELRKASILASIQFASELIKSNNKIENFTNFIDNKTAQFEKSKD